MLRKIELASCGAIITIRRDNFCIKCHGRGCQCCNNDGPYKGVHHKIAEWEKVKP